MVLKASAVLAIFVGLGAWSNASAGAKLDPTEISRFQQASFKGDCTGYPNVAEALLAAPEKERTSSTPYVLASASICAAKAGDWPLAEALGLKMYPKVYDGGRDWLLSVPLERLVVELADMPGGAPVVLNVIARNTVVAGQYPGDVERREQVLKIARASALYQLGRSSEAAAFIDPKILDFQVDRRFEVTWAPAPLVAADNVARHEAQLTAPVEATGLGSRFEAAMALNRTDLAVPTARQSMRAAADGTFGLSGEWEAVNARTALILALARSGRVEAALEAYEEGAPAENGRDTTFYRRRADGATAMMLIRADRPAEARALLAKLKPLPIAEDLAGAAVLDACASKLTGGSGLSAGQATWIGTISSLDALLCAASEDEVATEVIKALDQPRTRLGALAALQAYLEPAALGKTDTAMRARRAVFLDRADIKAAIARRGRILATGTYRLD